MNPPYLLWLIKVAQKINPGFQKKVCGLVGRDRYQGDPAVSKVKKLTRCIDKVGRIDDAAPFYVPTLAPDSALAARQPQTRHGFHA